MAEKLEMLLHIKSDGSMVFKKVSDDATKAFKSIEKTSTSTAKSMSSGWKTAAGIIATSFAAMGGAALAKSFLDVAVEAENLQVRLQVLTGSVEAGGQLFRNMQAYAERVPFTFTQIMDSATQLAGVMNGSVSAVSSWMPLIGDLAAATGLSIQTATEQVSRMLSAGAASADLFRQRGVLAMLGFQSGVAYSTKETEKMLIAAWTNMGSKFRGATDKLSNTWTGLVSMIEDEWTKLQQAFMSAGVFDALKSSLESFLPAFRKFVAEAALAFATNLPSYIEKTRTAFSLLRDAMGLVRDAVISLSIAFTTLFVVSILSAIPKIISGMGLVLRTFVELRSAVYGFTAMEALGYAIASVWGGKVPGALALGKAAVDGLKTAFLGLSMVAKTTIIGVIVYAVWKLGEYLYDTFDTAKELFWGFVDGLYGIKDAAVYVFDIVAAVIKADIMRFKEIYLWILKAQDASRNFFGATPVNTEHIAALENEIKAWKGVEQAIKDAGTQYDLNRQASRAKVEAWKNEALGMKKVWDEEKKMYIWQKQQKKDVESGDWKNEGSSFKHLTTNTTYVEPPESVAKDTKEEIKKRRDAVLELKRIHMEYTGFIFEEHVKQMEGLEIELEQQKNAVMDMLADKVISYKQAMTAIELLERTNGAKIVDLQKEHRRQIELLDAEYLGIQGKDLEAQLEQQRIAYEKDLQMARNNEELKTALTRNYEAQRAKYREEEQRKIQDKMGSLQVEALRNNYNVIGRTSEDARAKVQADYDSQFLALKLAYEKDSYEWRNNAEVKTMIDENYLMNKQNLNLQYQEAMKNDWQKWADEIKQIDQQIFEWSKQAASEFATGFTDAFYEFAEGTKSAKEAFQAFAASFLKNIAKMIMQQLILNAIQKAAGSYFGGIGGGGSAYTAGQGYTATPRASGGPMMAGKTYLTGENGPELISLKRGGYATPASRTKMGANITIAPNINISSGAGGTDKERKELARNITLSMRDMVKDVMVEEQQVGGISNPISVGRTY